MRTLRKANLVCQSSCVRRKRGSKPSRKSLLTSGILSGELHDSCEKSPSFGFFDVDEFFIILDFTEKIFSQFFCLFVMDFRPGSGSLTMTDQLHLHTVKNKTYEFWFVEIRFRVTQKFFRRGFIKSNQIIFTLIKLEGWRISDNNFIPLI